MITVANGRLLLTPRVKSSRGRMKLLRNGQEDFQNIRVRPNQRPLKNVPFCPIPASGSNFNPQNTQCIPVVKIFALTRGVHAPRPYGQLGSCPILLSCRIVLGLEQNWAFFKGLHFYPVKLFSISPGALRHYSITLIGAKPWVPVKGLGVYSLYFLDVFYLPDVR